MSTRLTLASNSCNPGNRAGDHSLSGKPHLAEAAVSEGGKGKACMVKAGLPEAQTRRVGKIRDVAAVDTSRRAIREMVEVPVRKGASRLSPLQPAERSSPCHGVNGRKGHLTTPHLIDRVTTGSPKRACLTRPVWRRSRHSSQTPGVMPRTATPKWTDTAETGRAIGRGTPAVWVKGGALAEFDSFRTTRDNPEGR